MATPFMTAAQVGTYFVTQYYSMLQQRPDLVHQLYSDASTMLRIDGHTREAANAMLQIHALVMSLHFTSIEIKTAHSLESWSGGIIVIVTGSVQIRDFSGRKKFAQTFFLAPQEKGIFVLNDIFHFIEDDQIHPYSASLMGQSLNNTLNVAPLVQEPASSYMMGVGMQARDYIPPVDIKENGTVDHYSMPEHRLQKIPDVESILEDNNPREQANGFTENTVNPIQEIPPSHIEESVEEPQKHTYASILRAARIQSATPAGSVPSNKAAAPPSEWQYNDQSAAQQPQQSGSMTAVNESSTLEMEEDILVTENRGSGEIKSVYVRNLPPTVSASEIEEEFKKFGQLTAEGVAIRRPKDTEVCYAFVEFEDMASVQSAIQAATVEIAGQQVYIEERRANSSFARGRRGRGRGRGRAGYHPDSSRGRFNGRTYSSRGGRRSGEREFNRARGNGYYKQTGRQDNGYSGNQASRSGHSIPE